MGREHGNGMGSDEAASKRRYGGPRPLGALLPALTRPAFKKRSPAAAQVMADWAIIAGPALAAVTVPRRLTAGTLTLACSGPIALELQHLSAELLARINGHLGQVVAERLRFVQELLPPPTVRTVRRPGPPVPVPGMPDGELRDALARLGRAVADRQRYRTG